MIKSSEGERDMEKYTMRGGNMAKYNGVKDMIKRWQRRIEEDRDMKEQVIELSINEENKCKSDQELQQLKLGNDICDYKIHTQILDQNNLVSDFRKMPRTQSISELRMKDRKMKRLQEGPRESSKKLQLERKTGRALQNLMSGIIQANPNIMLGEQGRRCAKMIEKEGVELDDNLKETETRMVGAGEISLSHEEEMILEKHPRFALPGNRRQGGQVDCLGMKDEHDDLLSKLEELSVGAKTDHDLVEDLSCWTELEMLNEEDFKEDLENAEIKMMNDFKYNHQRVSAPAAGLMRVSVPAAGLMIETGGEEVGRGSQAKQPSPAEDSHPAMEDEKETPAPKTPAKTKKNASPTPPPMKKRKIRTPVTKKTKKYPSNPSTTSKMTPAEKSTKTPKSKLKEAPIVNPKIMHTPAPTPATSPRRQAQDQASSSTPEQTSSSTPAETTIQKAEMFNIGHNPTKQPTPGGQVRKLRMEFERKSRQERRMSVTEIMRQRIVTTPKTKRNRNEEGDWVTNTPVQDAAPQPGPQAGEGIETGCRAVVKDVKGKSHTAISSFMIKKPPTSSKHPGKVQPGKIDNNILEKEMSALLGSSPFLRRRRTGMEDSAGVKDIQRRQTPVTEEVDTIAKYAVDGQEEDNTTLKGMNPDNNNLKYGRQDSTRVYQERDTYELESSQPTGSKIPHHVTGILTSRPIAIKIEYDLDQPRKSSHIETQEASE